jgi:hypothetical protein
MRSLAKPGISITALQLTFHIHHHQTPPDPERRRFHGWLLIIRPWACETVWLLDVPASFLPMTLDERDSASRRRKNRVLMKLNVLVTNGLVGINYDAARSALWRIARCSAATGTYCCNWDRRPRPGKMHTCRHAQQANE